MLNTPETLKQISDRIKTDVARNAPGTDPQRKNSLLGAICLANAARFKDVYATQELLLELLMPDTAQGEIAERWAAIWGKTYLPASKATGFIVCGGLLASAVPINSQWATKDGTLYKVLTTVNITAHVHNVSLSRVGDTVTAVCDEPHDLADNIPAVISGAVQTLYNGTHTISVLDEVTFTYKIDSTPVTPATGAIIVSYESALAPVESIEFMNSGENVFVNQDGGTILKAQTVLTGVNDQSLVYVTGLTGGADRESLEDLKTRYLEKIQNPVANFNESAIIEKAREVPGVTRVFVKPITPAVGEVTIYFMRDNDASPIPDAGEITTVKNKILEIKPVNTSTAHVHVLALTAVPRNITLTTLSPNSTSMQNAILANLTYYFKRFVSAEETVEAVDYISVIRNTIDTETGLQVNSFTLSSTADFTVSTGEINTLGVVSFP
jgi:uncharacterized phage protein gp47/JayE